MKIIVKRINLTNKYTEGEMYIDDKYYCKTLEDTNRDLNKNGKFDNGEKKVYGETCIPYGKYDVDITYSPKFKRNLPLIKNVPEFDGIRIHRGNKPEDTLGCILVGEKVKNGWLSNSTPFEEGIVNLINKAKSKGEKITIEIV